MPRPLFLGERGPLAITAVFQSSAAAPGVPRALREDVLDLQLQPLKSGGLAFQLPPLEAGGLEPSEDVAGVRQRPVL